MSYFVLVREVLPNSDALAHSLIRELRVSDRLPILIVVVPTLRMADQSDKRGHDVFEFLVVFSRRLSWVQCCSCFVRRADVNVGFRSVSTQLEIRCCLYTTQ